MPSTEILIKQNPEYHNIFTKYSIYTYQSGCCYQTLWWLL